MAGLMPRLSSEEAKLPEVDKESLRITTALRFADSVSKMFREQIVPSKQKQIVSILDKFEKLTIDISIGLPAEIKARRKQYEYYRNKLLTFL